MFGKKPELTAREARKQMLVLESDLNRALLIAELGAMKQAVRGYAGRIASAGALSAFATNLGALPGELFRAIFGQVFSPAGKSKGSSLSALLRCVRGGLGLWTGLRGFWSRRKAGE